MPSPYLRSKSVQVSKKVSIYAAFHCCRGVQVSPVLVRFPLFLYTCTTMKTPVFMRVCAIVVHFLIPSHGVRDRTGQAAFLRSARAGPSAKAGWRQVKFSLKPFSKGLWGCGGDAPAALVAFGKRRRVEKASCGRLFAGNPRRGFPDRAGGSA